MEFASKTRLDERPGRLASAARLPFLVSAGGRPEVAAQCRIATAMNDSPAVTDQRNLASWLNGGPRSVVRTAQLRSLFGTTGRLETSSGAVVQRSVSIGGDKVPDDDRKAAFRAYLQEWGIHYFHSYDTLAESVGENGDLAFEGKAGAESLAAALGAKFDGLKDQGEVQTHVQRKLVEICELFQVRIEQDQDPQLEEPRKAWYDQFINEGLCFGFVRIFQDHPEWLSGMWRALETWNPPHGAGVEAIIAALNHHIEAEMNFADGRAESNFLEAVLLAQEAWNNMKLQEEGGDEYGPEPEFVDNVVGSASGHASKSVKEGDETDEMFAVSPQNAGEVLNYIRQTATEPGWYHTIVWHSGHEMAVRYFCSAPGLVQDWSVVETSGAGIGKCGSWEEVWALIEPRLHESADKEFGLDVMRQTRK
jgi:hypothetical protein